MPLCAEAAWPKPLLLLLLNLAVIVEVGSSEILVCNTQTRMGALLIAEMHSRFTQPLSDECIHQSKLDSEDDKWCAFAVMCFIHQKNKQDRAARCNVLRQRISDRLLNVNARIPADQAPFSAINTEKKTLTSSDQALLRQDLTAEIDPRSPLLNFVPRTDKTVLWSTVVLAASRPSADEAAMAMPPLLYGAPLSFATDTFLLEDGGRASLSPDVVFGPALQLKVSNPKGRLVRGGIIMHGCAVPSFTLRVEWHRSSQTSGGAGGLTQTATTQEVCWRRVITLIEVRELLSIGAAPLRCFMFFTFNELRSRLQQPAASSEAELRLQTKKYIMDQNWATGILFPADYAEMILNCAQPAPPALGGVWYGQSTFSAGICVTCASYYAVQQQRMRGLQVRACNRSIAEDAARGDCCLGCAPATHMRIEVPHSGTLDFACVERCRKGTAYTAGRCTPCASGLYSAGGLGQCITCGALVGDPNAWVDPRQGCRICGTRAQLTSTPGCTPCDAGKYVPAGATVCTTCATPGYFVPPISVAAGCVPCAAGTYMPTDIPRQPRLCPQDTYAPLPGAIACIGCPAGHLSTYNRTACTPCASINATVMPFAEYFQRGCSLRCKPAVSYVRISPYSPHGCGSCDAAKVPVGAYASANDCTITPSCTNLPSLNAYYTTASSEPGNPQLCGWACNAGFFVQAGGGCAACNFGSAYSAARHRPLAACQYTCLPGIYADAARLCNQPCTDLLAEAAAGRISARVRETPPGPRPNYIHGVCGRDSDIAPRAEARFLRLGSWAYSSPTGGVCGNSLLNDGEECDDGNRVGGDGCSAACAVEIASTAYWECDLIGAPCVRNCGWSLTSPEPNGVGLFGFALPSCTVCACAALSYRYNVVPLSPKDRLAWMRSRLVSCNCGGNAMRTLPFAECTAANGGCRQCAGTTQYHDDLAGRCIECGSVCAPGFARAYDGVCVAGAAQVVTATDSSVAGQLAVGCVPCDVPAGPPVRFVRGCAYACPVYDVGGASTFCRSTELGADGVTCPSTCGLCSYQLQQLLLTRQYEGGASVLTVGLYPRGCSNGAGYVWAPCDTASRPTGAFWTSNSAVPGDSGGCAWQCGENYYAWRGQCIPCFTYTGGPAPCSPGQRLQWCSTQGAACIQCMGALSGAYRGWTSDPPYFAVCRSDCEALVSYSLSPNATDCLPCARPRCALGDLFVPCTPRSDALCTACAAPPTALLEFIVPGSCQTRCIGGFYADPLIVDGCLPCGEPCDLGHFSSSPACAAPTERLTKPLCLPCPPLQTNQVFFATPEEVCGARCAYGYVSVSANGSAACQMCRPALCGIGYYGACASDTPGTTRLACTQCAAARDYTVPGDCSFYATPNVAPPPPPSSAPPTGGPAAPKTDRSMLRGGVAHPELPYPNRTRQHSGMS